MLPYFAKTQPKKSCLQNLNGFGRFCGNSTDENPTGCFFLRKRHLRSMGNCRLLDFFSACNLKHFMQIPFIKVFKSSESVQGLQMNPILDFQSNIYKFGRLLQIAWDGMKDFKALKFYESSFRLAQKVGWWGVKPGQWTISSNHISHSKFSFTVWQPLILSASKYFRWNIFLFENMHKDLDV